MILAIETSCDDTCAAVVGRDGTVHGAIRSSQADLHARFGGVVPEIASRRHLELVVPVIEAALGFLGAGIPPPTPTWGNMLADSLNAGLVPPWWLVLFPGAAITLTVLAFNLFGDGLRDALDPRLRLLQRPFPTSP